MFTGRNEVIPFVDLITGKRVWPIIIAIIQINPLSVQRWEAP
jgi:hypothetical protein